MSVALYDEAFVKKLKKWTAGSNISITSPNDSKRFLEMEADKNNDETIKLPLIQLSRPLGYTLLSTTKKALTFSGKQLGTNGDEKIITLNAIPISVPYQIDIYTRYFDEADELARNIVFNLINYPRLTINIPYRDIQLVHDSNLRMSGEIEDTSGIPERLIPGQFSRMTIKLQVSDAYLFDVRLKDGYAIVETVFTDDN